MGDYYDDYYDDYPDTTTTTLTTETSTTTSTLTTLSSTLSSTTVEPTPSAEVNPWGGPFGAGTPSTAKIPEASSKATSHPFGGDHPFGGPEGIPESGPEATPEGFISVVEPEPGAEGEPRIVWVDGVCMRETSPWAEPEPEGKPERAYAEPPAPLFQPSNYRERGTYSTLAAVVATLIIVLNIAVLVVLARKPKQRKTLTYLIGLIAAFDTLGGLQFLWFSSFDVQLMFTHANMWIIVMCGIWMLTMAPQISAMLHFGLHLLNELHVGVNNAKISAGRIIFVVLTVFVLPVGLFIPPLAGWNCIGCMNPADDDYYCAKKCSLAIFPFTKIYVLLMVVLLFTAMVLVISIYATIYHTICQKKCRRQLSPKSGKTDVIRITTLLLTVYILCVLPVSIVMVFDYMSVKCNPRVIDAFHATMFVSFLSNLVNPIIVFCTLPSMRNASCKGKEEGKAKKRISNSSSAGNGVNVAYVDEKPPLDDEEKQVDEDGQEVTKI